MDADSCRVLTIAACRYAASRRTSRILGNRAPDAGSRELNDFICGRKGHPCGDGECHPFLFPAVGLASYKTDNKAHSPNTAPQTGTTVPIESLTAAGNFAQAILVRCAGPLSFISVRSKKRAKIRISPAMITSPKKKVPQPGPGKGANRRLMTTTKIPPTTTRTFRRAELPRPLR